MDLSKFGYEPIDLDDELFLTEVPLDLLEETISAQFDDPLDNRRSDYVQSFITKYNFSKENGHEDDQYVYDDIYDRFIEFMRDIFQERLDVGFPNIDEMEDEDALEMLQLAYRFFIKNIKKNFVSMAKNYIDNDKARVLANLEHKKDVTTLNFRLELDDEDDVLIISNLNMVIKDFLHEVVTTYDVDDFFKACVRGELCLETAYVQSKYAQFKMVGNFIEKYVHMIDRNFQYEIESNIRNYILKKYSNRLKDDPIVPAASRQDEQEDEAVEES